MEYRVWLIQYDPTTFKPSHWQDNPTEGVVELRITGWWSLTRCRGCAQGFNDEEINKPVGRWAIICAKGQEPEVGQRVSLTNQPQPCMN
jgi:hypothetical protein